MSRYKHIDPVKDGFSQLLADQFLLPLILLSGILLLSCVVETGFQQAFLLISLNPVQALTAWGAPLGIGLGEIPMWKIIPAGLLGWLLLSADAMAACTSIPNTFTNGTTADAGHVNANFTYLGSCAAPEISPVFTGNVGIGISPSNYKLSIVNSGTNGNWSVLGALFAAGESIGAYPSVGYNIRGTGGAAGCITLEIMPLGSNSTKAR